MRLVSDERRSAAAFRRMAQRRAARSPRTPLSGGFVVPGDAAFDTIRLVKIGIAATRLAGVDGVTFEPAKWEAVLDAMGHELRLCAGEVDALSSNTLRHLLRASNGSPVERVLDLEDLTFIEHTGVLALHEYAEGMRAQGFGLTIRGGPPTMRRLADLLGVRL